jgi:hypothetical protein
MRLGAYDIADLAFVTIEDNKPVAFGTIGAQRHRRREQGHNFADQNGRITVGFLAQRQIAYQPYDYSDNGEAIELERHLSD